ncbi:hypothetical protein BDK51DRAFT_48669 [Blyttiomyces helicus]|uniref:Peptidase A1 domain-containing protein n=1 Tax=Blyttiomyces helicus TaxID=388810 RepID=A0A4P9VY85_9FUNG|nr:hypothetical protein BDK51DRAFT_48669 [Blyttiomyces helicus]|eukprot:RKO83905.1 hypothetical protein BDK51DRAFT_48669 [Blyttiomyces helicus]
MHKQTLLFCIAVATVCTPVDADGRRHHRYHPPIAKAIAPLTNVGWDGRYTTNITIGTGAHAVTLPFLMDTGSDTFWMDGSVVHARDYKNTTQPFSESYVDGSAATGYVYCGGFEIAGVKADAESGCFGIANSIVDGAIPIAGLMRPMGHKKIGDTSFVGVSI